MEMPSDEAIKRAAMDSGVNLSDAEVKAFLADQPLKDVAEAIAKTLKPLKPLPDPHKFVTPGDWRTLEWTIGAKCIASFREPAGLRIKISKFIKDEDEQVLDGVNYKYLILTFGK